MRVLLAALALALAAVLVWQWRDWPTPTPQVTAADPKVPSGETSEPPEDNPLVLLTPLGEKEEYAEVTERPLFLPDRRPASEEPSEEEPAEPEQIGDLARIDLNAVMITPAESSAWVRDPAVKELVRLRPGDDLAGWSVKEILSDRLLLERQGETDTLILRDYKNMPPPAPPRQKRAARKRRQQAPQQAAGGQPQAPDARQQDVNRPNATQRPGTRNPRLRANARPPQQQSPQEQR